MHPIYWPESIPIISCPVQSFQYGFLSQQLHDTFYYKVDDIDILICDHPENIAGMDEQSVYKFDGCIRGIKVTKLCQICGTVLTIANMSDKENY